MDVCAHSSVIRVDSYCSAKGSHTECAEQVRTRKGEIEREREFVCGGIEGNNRGVFSYTLLQLFESFSTKVHMSSLFECVCVCMHAYMFGVYMQ